METSAWQQRMGKFTFLCRPCSDHVTSDRHYDIIRSTGNFFHGTQPSCFLAAVEVSNQLQKKARSLATSLRSWQTLERRRRGFCFCWGLDSLLRIAFQAAATCTWPGASVRGEERCQCSSCHTNRQHHPLCSLHILQEPRSERRAQSRLCTSQQGNPTFKMLGQHSVATAV